MSWLVFDIGIVRVINRIPFVIFVVIVNEDEHNERCAPSDLSRSKRNVITVQKVDEEERQKRRKQYILWLNMAIGESKQKHCNVKIGLGNESKASRWNIKEGKEEE